MLAYDIPDAWGIMRGGGQLGELKNRGDCDELADVEMTVAKHIGTYNCYVGPRANKNIEVWKRERVTASNNLASNLRSQQCEERETRWGTRFDNCHTSDFMLHTAFHFFDDG